jgi:hypothetical protein
VGWHVAASKVCDVHLSQLGRGRAARRDGHRFTAVAGPRRSRADLVAIVAGDVGDSREALQFAASVSPVGEDQYAVHRTRSALGGAERNGEI